MKNIKNNRSAEKEEHENGKREKKFDKRKYRLQKYSNKYKINQWEEKRKKAVLRGYYKELKKDQQNSSQTSSNLNHASKNTNEISNSKNKSYAFYKAKREYKRKQEEKKKRIEEAIRVKTEREEALRKYKQKKLHNFKVLSKKDEERATCHEGQNRDVA